MQKNNSVTCIRQVVIHSATQNNLYRHTCIGSRNKTTRLILLFDITICAIKLNRYFVMAQFPELRACACCGNQDQKLSACGGCHGVLYCCRNCQTTDWKNGHKHKCATRKISSVASVTSTTVPAEAKVKKCEPATECANCGTLDPPLKRCTRCFLVHYCSRFCQRAHWSEGHKQACVSINERTPKLGALSEIFSLERDICAICLCCVDGTEVCVLPCAHIFHSDCIKELRKFGVSPVCPLCRSKLPPSPEDLHDIANWYFLVLRGRVTRGEMSWGQMNVNERTYMNEALRLWREAADLGYDDACCALGVVYEEGYGVPQDRTQAEVWYRKTKADIDARNNLGSILRAKGDFDLAEAEFRFALRINQQHLETRHNLGSLLLAKGDLIGAKAEIIALLEIDPKYWEARFTLGNVLLAMGDLTGAEYNYRALLEMNPTSVELHCNLGIVLHMQNNLSQAESEYREALRIDPTHSLTRRHLKTLLRDICDP